MADNKDMVLGIGSIVIVAEKDNRFYGKVVEITGMFTLRDGSIQYEVFARADRYIGYPYTYIYEIK